MRMIGRNYNESCNTYKGHNLLRSGCQQMAPRRSVGGLTPPMPFHMDMKGHTGATMSMGKGSIYSHASAQKLVARSSTKTELIGVLDILPQVIWTRNFLELQFVSTSESVLYQDNMSTMLMATNRHASGTKHICHNKIQYFFFKVCG